MFGIYNKKTLLVFTAVLLTNVFTPSYASPYIPSLTINLGAGALGGSVSYGPYGGGFNSDVKTVPLPNGNSASDSITSTAPDGSYADANAIATYGFLHAYADAHRASASSSSLSSGYNIGDAQSQAHAESIDYFQSGVNNASYMETLNVTGSHSIDNPTLDGGVAAYALFNFNVYDITAGKTLASLSWTSTNLQPETLQTIQFTVPNATDVIQVDTYLQANAYVMSNEPSQYLTATSDYSHTLILNMDALTVGANTVGYSGYNYASPVPIPASLPLFSMAMAGLIGLMRRQPC